MTDYPAYRRHLNGLIRDLGRETPDTIAGFGALRKAALAPGALDAKTKELMAASIAVATRCEGCIAFHVHDALKAGATHAEVVEAIGVAVLMGGGGPALMYAAEAYEALQQFEAEQAAAPPAG